MLAENLILLRNMKGMSQEQIAENRAAWLATQQG